MVKTKRPEHVTVFITAADEEEARLISQILLKQRKAACINIIPRVDSLFWWQGKIDSVQESLLVIKTRSVMLNEITQLIKEIHSNDIPEIIALPVIGGNPEYLKWIDNETA